MGKLVFKFTLLFFSIVFVFCNEVAAFDYKEVKSGDSYETVKRIFNSKGNTVNELDETRLTTEYGSNILATLVFKDDKLCKVYTDYGEREFRWIISDIDYRIRHYGNPLKVVASGEAWGDGFTILWEHQNQTIIYDVGKLDLFGKQCSTVKSTKIDGNICSN